MIACSHDCASAQDTPETTTLEEIVVTASKRGERDAQDIPISISVIHGAGIDDGGQDELLDVLSGVPGLSVFSRFDGAFTAQIRGSSSFSGDATVGVYYDDLPFTLLLTTETPEVDPFDLDRIEVLKGPQGTLYGAGASGGVIRILTEPVNLDGVTGKFRSQIGYTEGAGAEHRTVGAANVPIVKGVLGVRVSGGYAERPGFLNDLGGNVDFNKSDTWFVRGKLAYTPVDNLELRASAWIQRTDGAFTGASDNLVAASPLPLFAFPPEAGGFGVPEALLFSTDEGGNTVDFELFNLAADWALPSFNLYTTTSFINYDNFQDNPIFQINGALLNETLAHETRISSSGEAVFEWTTGVSYNSIEQGLPVSSIPVGVLGTDEERSSRQIAGFGEVHAFLFDRQLELTGGLRYFDDRRTFEVSDNPVIIDPSQPPVNLTFDETVANFDQLSYRGNICFRKAGHLLYVNVATGFRSGGFNLGGALAIAPAGTVETVYEDETVTSYEIGAKLGLPSGKVALDAAAYYNDFDDILFSTATPTGLLVLTNGGDARALGVDISLNYQATEYLTLQLGGNFNESEYRTSNEAIGIERGDPIQFVPSTSLSAAADYRRPIRRMRLTAFGTANVSYTSRRSDRGARPIQDPPVTGPIVGFDQFDTLGDRLTFLDLRIGVENEHWSFFIFSNNTTNENGGFIELASTNFALEPFGLQDSPRPRPRTIGLGFSVRLQ